MAKQVVGTNLAQEDYERQPLYNVTDWNCIRRLTMKNKQVQKQAPEEKLGYNLLLQNAADLGVSQYAVNKLLRYFTDTLGWGMNRALLYTLELFENGTIAEIKSWGKTEG